MGNNSRAPVIIGLILLSLVGIRLVFTVDPVSRLAEQILSPISNQLSQVSFNYEPAQIDLSREQQDQITTLEDQVAQLRADLRFAKSLPFNTISADVTQKDIQSFQKNIVVNAGSSSGVKKGDPVLASGTLIGKVERVGNTSSDVILINDPRFRTTATTVKGESQGVIKTEHGSLFFDLVPKDKQTGDVVKTSGVDGELPPGLIIGEVGESVETGESIFKKYLVILTVNAAEVESVLIGVSE